MSGGEPLVLFRRAPRAADRRRLAAFAAQLKNEVAQGGSFLCLIADDRELRRLYRQFFGEDRTTDVLAFPEAGPDGFLGEIAISAEQAARQAHELGHSLEQELCILMLHGLLHLVGMDHARDRGRMARAETRWRKHFGLPAGLIERSRK